MLPLKKLIITEIEVGGPMRLDRYMQLCLAHPEFGYYIKKDPFGEKGDFTTAPEISQIFGEIIGVWCAAKWESLGRPKKIALVELGPGRGTLMADLLRAVKKINDFQPEVHMVEISPYLRKIQQDKLKYHEIYWHDEFPQLNLPVIVIANEFFDALPIRQFVGEKERMLVTDGRELSFNMAAEDGITQEVCETGKEIMTKISSNCAAGVIIDYGYLASQNIDTLQAVSKHKYVSVVDEPGEADLTAHVDFEQLTNSSIKPTSLYTQRDFLLNYGADVRAKILKREDDLNRLIAPEQMGNLFKVLCF